jgi:hypothetical protein
VVTVDTGAADVTNPLKPSSGDENVGGVSHKNWITVAVWRDCGDYVGGTV